ncbi:rod shape-determining protein MreC [Lactovum miscens]|uniref:Cell shape-determining protein MreC n=1 Tax=Lactovum miscens TaxID=190387 RepID=A0A841C3C1_9LACT|nr:rod shape-determining protein MreC [Lactovum miscens]MBB5888456.1 rod shape-determining protein MreC [Lactovum miscens]
MKKFNFSKVIIIALLIIIASFSIITISFRNYQKGKAPNDLIKVINDGTGTVDELFSSPLKFVESKFNDFQSVMNAYNQNASLKMQLSDSTMKSQKIASLEQENTELKAALNMQASLTGYKIENSSVISRNPSSWNNLLVIDKGGNSGLKNNMIVMSNGGIIGLVAQVNDATSKVELFSASSNLTNKIPIRIGNNYGLLIDFDKKSGDYIVSNMYSLTSVNVGDEVVTSGLDGSTPSDLLFGKVEKISSASAVAAKNIYVKPTADFNDLRFVAIILPN